MQIITNFARPLLLIGLISLLASGCSSLRFPGVYRIDIGQGNILTQEMVEKLRIGMTPRQVEYVMGSPMIIDTFHPDRWDYLYHLETGKGLSIRNHLVLYFENERLARIDDSLYKDPDDLRNNLLEQLGLPTAPKANDSESEEEEESPGEATPKEEAAEPTAA